MIDALVFSVYSATIAKRELFCRALLVFEANFSSYSAFRADYYCSPIELFFFLISRYLDGERLEFEDEKIVMEKLLAYHPYSKDKIGCGLDFIMVRRFNYKLYSYRNYMEVFYIFSNNHDR